MTMREPARQSGAALLLLLMGLSGLLLALSVGVLRVGDQARTNHADADRLAYLRDAQARLARWYEYHSVATGAVAGQIDMAQALAAAGITPRYGLQSASSVRQTDGTVSWHVMALWLPDPLRVQGTSFDTATGIFTPGTWVSNGVPATVVNSVLDGHASQLRLYSQSSRQVRQTAGLLENMFTAKRASDPFARNGYDWYRAQDCNAVQADELPCYDTYTDLSTTLAPVQAGIATSVNAWGLPIAISNLQDSNLVSPYSMAVSTTTPWGAVISALAQEP